ncbi:MAG: choice-of-anchor Q domain-containing protein, partial [Candidatus Binatus sp.]
PSIVNTLTIDGTGQAITIDGANSYQELFVSLGATLNLNNLTIAHGYGPYPGGRGFPLNNDYGGGGGVWNIGTLTVTNCTFLGNHAQFLGGGIRNGGTMTVTDSVFSANSSYGGPAFNSSQFLGYGGAVYNEGPTATISGSTFSGNGGYEGGGILSINGTLNVTNSTFSDNNSADNGGGINNSATLNVTNSTFFDNNSADDGGGIYSTYFMTVISGTTFSGNSASNDGGGMWIVGGGAGGVTVTNSTFSRNRASNDGGGIYGPVDYYENVVTNTTFASNRAALGGATYGVFQLANSILSASSGGNCSGTINTGGYNNISDDATCGLGVITGANGQTLGDNVNPLLSASGLQNNGGPTQTIALAPGSSAITAVPLAQCTVTTDQRGDPRPAPGYNACDIGAYEFAGIVVNTMSDSSTSGDHLCSLREAINNANSPGTDTTGGDCAVGTGNDTIAFSVSGTISLTSALPAIANTSSGRLTIDATGQTITIDGASKYQVLIVNSGATLDLNNLTIADGNTAGAGGGIRNDGILTVTNCTFANNKAVHAGGASGGAIFNDGTTTTVTDSSFLNNAGAGGAIVNLALNFATALTVTNCTFSSNNSIATGSYGGAILSEAFNGFKGTVTITNSTFSDNRSEGGVFGGAIYNGANGDESATFITNSTFSGNTGVIYDESGTVMVENSILAKSGSGGGCSANFGTITDGGYNISDDTTCGFTGTAANGHSIGDGASDLGVALDPAGLANNGGATETIKLEPGSYAINAVPLAHQCPATDQRGSLRPDLLDNSGACDIGAYESAPTEGLEELAVNPAKINFGTVGVGTTSGLQTATIANDFNDDTVDFFASFVAANFVKISSTCGSTLGPLQSCQLEFACRPKRTGSIIGFYGFLYGSWEPAGMDGDDFRRIGVVQFTCTGG